MSEGGPRGPWSRPWTETAPAEETGQDAAESPQSPPPASVLLMSQSLLPPPSRGRDVNPSKSPGKSRAGVRTWIDSRIMGQARFPPRAGPGLRRIEESDARAPPLVCAHDSVTGGNVLWRRRVDLVTPSREVIYREDIRLECLSLLSHATTVLRLSPEQRVVGAVPFSLGSGPLRLAEVRILHERGGDGAPHSHMIRMAPV